MGVFFVLEYYVGAGLAEETRIGVETPLGEVTSGLAGVLFLIGDGILGAVLHGGLYAAFQPEEIIGYDVRQTGRFVDLKDLGTYLLAVAAGDTLLRIYPGNFHFAPI